MKGRRQENGLSILSDDGRTGETRHTQYTTRERQTKTERKVENVPWVVGCITDEYKQVQNGNLEKMLELLVNAIRLHEDPSSGERFMMDCIIDRN